MAGRKSPFQIPNVRLFVGFRVFFNSRFYYPVFTILFLDFGLTLEEFAILNAVWAATIVMLEVPSGALADTIGRRNLLVTASVLMVLEMALLCFAPVGKGDWLFLIFLCNRVLSGTAEASASGADEALAYDTLKDEGDPGDWSLVLEKEMRARSTAFIVASLIGAAVYDPALMERVVEWLGMNVRLTQDLTLRFPVFLTLMMAVMALISTLRMKEVSSSQETALDFERGKRTVAEAFRMTLQAGKWIWRTPFALVVIAGGVLFDHITRMVVTLNSEYYRLIDLPEASFGIIGSGAAVMGLFVPHIALMLVKHHSPRFNLAVVSVLTLAGLLGVNLFLPIVGLVPVLVVFSVLHFTHFFVSHYLNQITGSDQRATVLSFKGLSLNLAYGAIGVLYSLLLAGLRQGVTHARPELSAEAVEGTVFAQSIGWFPWYFILTVCLLWAFAAWKMRTSHEHRRTY